KCREAMPVRAATRAASHTPGTCATSSAVLTARSGIMLPVPAMRIRSAVFLGAAIALLLYRRVDASVNPTRRLVFPASLTWEYKHGAMSTMRPLPKDPWPVELPEYLRHVSVSPTEVRAYDVAASPDEFYEDDRQITAAALQLHPLLGDDAVA